MILWPEFTWHTYLSTAEVFPWSILIVWPEYWPLIGQYWSCDLNTGLWTLISDCLFVPGESADPASSPQTGSEEGQPPEAERSGEHWGQQGPGPSLQEGHEASEARTGVASSSGNPAHFRLQLSTNSRGRAGGGQVCEYWPAMSLEYWSLIGLYWSCNLNTGLSLVTTGHMTLILSTLWSILVMRSCHLNNRFSLDDFLFQSPRWPGGVAWAALSHGGLSRVWPAPELNTGLWLVNTDHVTWILACD